MLIKKGFTKFLLRKAGRDFAHKNILSDTKKIGFNYVCITSGGIIPKTKIKFKKGYQVFLANKVKKNCSILVKTTGMIKDLRHAEKIVKEKKADLVSFGRKFINSPNWLVKQLIKNNLRTYIPDQYKRCF